jgi:hypothetical protein
MDDREAAIAEFPLSRLGLCRPVIDAFICACFIRGRHGYIYEIADFLLVHIAKS